MSIYWIKVDRARLGIMSRPRGDDWLFDDIRVLRQSGVDVIVSALTDMEAAELGLVAEAEVCLQNGLLYVSFPIEDRSLPRDLVKFRVFVDGLVEHATSGKSVVVHCRAGIGRSSVIAACVLVSLGLSTDESFRLIEKTRGCPVPDTTEQRKWVENFSDS